ncbi:MAG: hypothetical protein LQ342_004521 [Letrouitia transgressa]|nr:MAG: hypothetical protein LQ342_004521 [Letrouitia transgressa]
MDRPPPSPLTGLFAGPTITSHYSHMRKVSGLRIAPTMMPFNPESQRTGRPTAEDNVPNSFELFLLAPGEKKVTEETDTRIPSASVFTFKKEDHTLGNLLRSRLLQSPHVLFSGYKVPHPLVSEFILRIQTDGSLTPRQALLNACKELVHDLGILSREFTKEWELRKMVGEGVDGAANGTH